MDEFLYDKDLRHERVKSRPQLLLLNMKEMPFIARRWQYHRKYSLGVGKVSNLKTNTVVITHRDKNVIPIEIYICNTDFIKIFMKSYL